MEFQEQLISLLQTNILGILNIGAGYLIYYIKQLADKAKLKNQSNKNAEQKVLVDNAIERLNALIEKSVIATNETVAKEIKIALADHRVDRDELLKLKDTVIADVTKQISTDTTELLSTEIADLNGYISNQIEVVLANLKNQ